MHIKNEQVHKKRTMTKRHLLWYNKDSTIGGVVMSGKKGMKKYPERIRNEIRQKQEGGESVKSLSREYGISRWAIQQWCGLTKEKRFLPKVRGRKPARTLQEYKYENKRLKMENELLRDFLSLTERK